MLQEFFSRLSTPPLFNTTDYTIFGLATFGAGCALWAVVYVIVIYDIFKKKIVGIPVGAVACNFAWECYWGLAIFRITNMGSFLQWSYFIWWFTDILIVVSVFLYGWKQSVSADGRRYHVISTFIIFAMWNVLFCFFIRDWDDKIGAFSGWIDNVNMSVLYCVLKLKQPSFGTNRLVAVFKFMATGLCTGVVFTTPYLYANTTLVALCFTFAAFDLMYIYLVFTGPKHSSVSDSFVPPVMAAA